MTSSSDFIVAAQVKLLHQKLECFAVQDIARTTRVHPEMRTVIFKPYIAVPEVDCPCHRLMRRQLPRRKGTREIGNVHIHVVAPKEEIIKAVPISFPYVANRSFSLQVQILVAF